MNVRFHQTQPKQILYFLTKTINVLDFRSMVILFLEPVFHLPFSLRNHQHGIFD